MNVEYSDFSNEVWIWTNIDGGALINEEDWQDLVYFIHHNTEWSDKK